MSDKRERYEDQFIDQALRERIGGQQPPDLADRILSAANDTSTPTPRRPSRSDTAFARHCPFVVAATLLITLLAASTIWRADTKEIARRQQLRDLEIALRQSKSTHGMIDDEIEAAFVEVARLKDSGMTIVNYPEYLRRAYLDVTGKLPDADQIQLIHEGKAIRIDGEVFTLDGHAPRSPAELQRIIAAIKRDQAIAANTELDANHTTDAAELQQTLAEIQRLDREMVRAHSERTRQKLRMVRRSLQDKISKLQSLSIVGTRGSLLEEFELEEGRFLELVEMEKAVYQEKIEAEIEKGLKVARDRLGIDAEGAVSDLKILMETVDRAIDLDDEVRKQIRENIESAVHEAARRAVGQGERRTLLEQNRAVAIERQRLVEKSAANRERVGEAIEGFNSLLDESPYDEGKADVIKKLKEQSKRTWRRAKATPNAARLVVGDKDELVAEGMQVNVVIDGFRARVLVDYYFYNDRDRQLEGAFKLRLPNDASLFYFAFGETRFEYKPQQDQLASNGFLNEELVRGSSNNPDDIFRARDQSFERVKEARMVPREKAAYAYKETTRRRIDPALVEWSGAGIFNARVFPLAPGKLNRIVVGYDVNLAHDGEDLVYRLALPRDRRECFVDLNVAQLSGVAVEVSTTEKPFEHNQRSYWRFKNPKNDLISVRLKQPGPMFLTGSDADVGDFFAAEVRPELDAREQADSSPNAMFLLDTSLSSNPERFNVWLDILRATLDKNRDTIKSFAVLTFNIEAHWWRDGFTANTPDNVEAFLEYAHTLALEGATDLGLALREAANPSSWPNRGEYVPPDLFLLSDGAVTWGEANLHMLAKPLASGAIASLFAYKTGMSGTATHVLEHLARESGGAVFSVTNDDEVSSAATAHRLRPWRLLSVAVTGCDDVLVAGRPQSIYPGQRLQLVGRGKPSPHAEVVLKVRRGMETKEIRTSVGRVVPSQLAPRVYGHVAVGQLEDLYESGENVATAYARHFRITGHTCSLLMLETEEDYQRFNIKPENDALKVKEQLATIAVANRFDEIGSQLNDEKRRLIKWLERMEQMPGVEFQIPKSLHDLIKNLPQSAFEIEVPRLKCKLRQTAQLSKSFSRHLQDYQKSGILDYDEVSREAAEQLRKYGPADALKATSSLIENNPGDVVLRRDVAFSAIDWGLAGQACPLLRRAAAARPFEPHAYHAMARCLVELDKLGLAVVYFETALAGRWDERFGEFRKIVGVEYRRMLQQIVATPTATTSIRQHAKRRLASLPAEFDVSGADVVVTVMWNTDRTDVDLHVTEPTGETCSYENTRTKIGGRITRDVTEGYGPEMYTLRHAPAGKYEIKIHYFGSDTTRTSTRTKVHATIYEEFGSERERVTTKTLHLGAASETRAIGTLMIGR